MAVNTMGKEWVDVLADVPIFEGLSKRHLTKIAKLAVERRFAPHTRIVQAGDRGDAFYVIIDGSATVRRAGRRPVALGRGDFFGEVALLDGAARTATVEADDDILVMRIGRSSFQKMLLKEPRVAVHILEALATRLRNAQSSPTD